VKVINGHVFIDSEKKHERFNDIFESLGHAKYIYYEGESWEGGDSFEIVAECQEILTDEVL